MSTRTFSLVPIALCALWSATFAQLSDEDYKPKVVLRRPMQAITDASVVAADMANVDDDELVIGVVIDGEARAYPINQLTGPDREIINDELAGTAIAATW